MIFPVFPVVLDFSIIRLSFKVTPLSASPVIAIISLSSCTIALDSTPLPGFHGIASPQVALPLYNKAFPLLHMFAIGLGSYTGK